MTTGWGQENLSLYWSPNTHGYFLADSGHDVDGDAGFERGRHFKSEGKSTASEGHSVVGPRRTTLKTTISDLTRVRGSWQEGDPRPPHFLAGNGSSSPAAGCGGNRSRVRASTIIPAVRRFSFRLSPLGLQVANLRRGFRVAPDRGSFLNDRLWIIRKCGDGSVSFALTGSAAPATFCGVPLNAREAASPDCRGKQHNFGIPGPACAAWCLWKLTK
jgi:hypothetical protein